MFEEGKEKPLLGLRVYWIGSAGGADDCTICIELLDPDNKHDRKRARRLATAIRQGFMDRHYDDVSVPMESDEGFELSIPYYGIPTKRGERFNKRFGGDLEAVVKDVRVNYRIRYAAKHRGEQWAQLQERFNEILGDARHTEALIKAAFEIISPEQSRER